MKDNLDRKKLQVVIYTYMQRLVKKSLIDVTFKPQGEKPIVICMIPNLVVCFSSS